MNNMQSFIDNYLNLVSFISCLQIFKFSLQISLQIFQVHLSFWILEITFF